jgi:hypothetical protein
VVAAATLGTLALLAIANLGSRHQVDEPRATVARLTAAVDDAVRDDVPADRFLAVRAPAVDGERRGADDIRLVGVTLARTLGVTSPDLYGPRIESTMEILSHLASAAGVPGRVDVRLLPFVPAFGMYLIDPGEPDGRAYVELYQHRSLEPNPCFGLRAERDGRWYRFFVTQFDVLWDSARPVPRKPQVSGTANV